MLFSRILIYSYDSRSPKSGSRERLLLTPKTRNTNVSKSNSSLRLDERSFFSIFLFEAPVVNPHRNYRYSLCRWIRSKSGDCRSFCRAVHDELLNLVSSFRPLKIPLTCIHRKSNFSQNTCILSYRCSQLATNEITFMIKL